MDRYNIGGTSYSQLMNEKTQIYNGLLRKAEIANRDNGGKPSKEEGNYYYDAANVCAEIINMNLSQRSIVMTWTQRKKECEAEFDRIRSSLCPPPKPKPVPEKPQDAASGPLAVSSKVPDRAPSGFTTKNACKEVPADVIEKWFKNTPSHGLEDVTGMDEQKNLLMTKAGNLGWDRLDSALKLSPLQSFFFYGPPGSGKTFLIEAFANEMIAKGFKYIRLTGGDIHASLVGVAEKTVQIAMQEAIDNEPCIIFIDEIENVCVTRSKPGAEGHERRLTVAFLEAYNLLKTANKRVVFMGATNYPSQVDEAMLDRITLVPIPLPDEEVRANYFKHAFRQLSFDVGFSVENMAAATENYSFRDLDRLSTYVLEQLRQITIDDYTVITPEGELDQDETDKRAADAVNSGEVVLTRSLFEEAREALPPSSKAASIAELEAFEAKVRGLDISV